jgi:MFS family permease
MYSIDWVQVLGRSHRCGVCTGCPHSATDVHARPRVLPRVSAVVWSLGFTSMLTDISSEMVASILPMYLVLHLRLSPLAFGVVDGLYQGVAVLLRVAAGVVGDRWQQHKMVAAVGYGLSAVCKLGILAAGSAWGAIAAFVALDRSGKGIRTAPRDAMITLASPCRELATAFGVHRALDAAGAMLGPLAAVLLLAALPDRFDVIFLASFGLAALGLAVLVLFVDAPRRERANLVAAESPSLATTLGLLRDRRFRALFITTAVLSLSAVSDAFVFLVLQRRAGFSAAMFPMLYVGVSLVNFLMAVPGGGMADRTGRLRVFLGGHALLLVVYALLLLPEIGLGHVVICLVLLGGYYAATDGVLAAIAGAALPPHLCGSGLALISTPTSGSRLLASMLFGALWTWQGIDIAVVCFMIGMAIAVAAAAKTLAGTGAHALHDPAGIS